MKSFAIIGCGRFGMSIAETLFELGNEVLAVDINPEHVEEVSDYVTYAVEADSMDESVLKELGLNNFDVVIVGIGSNLEASIMTTLILKEVGAKKIVAKAQSKLHGKLLSKIGADKVVFPEIDMGVRLAYNLASSNILDYIEFSPDFSILEVTALKAWHNKSLGELKLRNKYGINIIAIKDGDYVKVAPGPNYIIGEESTLVMLGGADDVKKIEIGMEED